jgi:hypothetical protein
MIDVLPTFRKICQAISAWGDGFSYRDSVVTKGAVWTLLGWLPVPLFCAFMQAVSVWSTELGAETSYIPDLGMLLVLTGFPWAPLAGFTLGCWLAGRAPGLWAAIIRGLKATFVLIFALMAAAILALVTGDEKAGLVAAGVFWLGVLTAFMSVLGASIRRLYNILRPE